MAGHPQNVTPGPDYTVNTRCPACGYRGSAIVLSTSTISITSIFVVAVLVMTCACCFLGNVKDTSLAYYCEGCGLRFVTENNDGSQVQYDNNTLVSEASLQKGSRSGQSLSDYRVAMSPLGPPAPVNRANIINLHSRYRHMKPKQLAVVETGRFGLPVKVVMQNDHLAVSYTIESPGIPSANPSVKDDPQFLQTSCAWNNTSIPIQWSPHFRIVSGSNVGPTKEVARVGLHGRGNWNAEVCAVNYDLPDVENSSSRPNKTQWVNRHICVADEGMWKTRGSGILWTSSKGVLLWSTRKMVDAENVKGQLLCLLDAYDRLVLAVRKVRRPGGGQKGWEMRVYADLSEEYLGELIASYTALRCQQQRSVQEHMYDESSS